MKPGPIHQYAHLSNFQTLQQLNESITNFLKKFGNQFTKGERLAFQTLTRFSVKVLGICNARICKLVEAAQANKGGISRSTFERMLRKARQLGMITIHHTTRKKGGTSHNVYVFHPIDGAIEEKLTERPPPRKSDPRTVQSPKTNKETMIIENKKIKEKDLRPISLENLDATYVPSYIPIKFTDTVRPFFNRAKEICNLWDRAMIAYRSMKFSAPIEQYLPTIIKAFKETVYKYKQGKLRTGFMPYFYGTVTGMLVAEKRRMVAEQTIWCSWLED